MRKLTFASLLRRAPTWIKINKYATNSLKLKRININTIGIGELHLNYGNDTCLIFEKSFKRKSAQKTQNGLNVFDLF